MKSNRGEPSEISPRIPNPVAEPGYRRRPARCVSLSDCYSRLWLKIVTPPAFRVLVFLAR